MNRALGVARCYFLAANEHLHTGFIGDNPQLLAPEGAGATRNRASKLLQFLGDTIVNGAPAELGADVARFPPSKVDPVVPPLDDPKWFEFWDADLSGSLDTQELTLALLHTFNLTGAARRDDRASFVENVGVIIMLLDPNQDGTVDRDEWPGFRSAIQLNLRA